MATADVSIVIPSYNRGRSVRETVSRCLLLDPAPREIVLVDDHSNDGSEEIIRQLTTGIVTSVRLPSNQGQAAARSVGFAMARGKYVVSLDDDSWFLDNDALQRISERFESLPQCGILALRGFSPGVPIQNSKNQLSLVADHITCGAAYRADVIHQTGYHLPLLRYEGEEADISLKVLDAGFDIVFDESIRFFHDYDPAKRPVSVLMNVRRFAVRNDLLRCLIYFPVELALGVGLWRVASHLSWGLRSGAMSGTVRGFADALVKWPGALRHRRPISRRASLRYLKLRRRPQVLEHAAG
jgi:glycosyltransferase involved in cell wall biosynthesis